MKELLEALKALESLGASWKARRVSKVSLFDTVECISFAETDEGVVQGLVEVQGKDQDDRQVKAEIACYLGGRLKDNGTFNGKKHPKARTVKLFEYQSFVRCGYSNGFLGFGRGLRLVGIVPAEHHYLADFAEWLVSEIDREDRVEASAKADVESARKSANEAKARRALFE